MRGVPGLQANVRSSEKQSAVAGRGEEDGGLGWEEDAGGRRWLGEEGAGNWEDLCDGEGEEERTAAAAAGLGGGGLRRAEFAGRLGQGGQGGATAGEGMDGSAGQGLEGEGASGLGAGADVSAASRSVGSVSDGLVMDVGGEVSAGAVGAQADGKEDAASTGGGGGQGEEDWAAALDLDLFGSDLSDLPSLNPSVAPGQGAGSAGPPEPILPWGMSPAPPAKGGKGGKAGKAGAGGKSGAAAAAAAVAVLRQPLAVLSQYCQRSGWGQPRYARLPIQVSDDIQYEVSIDMGPPRCVQGKALTGRYGLAGAGGSPAALGASFPSRCDI